ncbi:hypothetical protein VFPPC_14915 [Pochonia chlamydosporia 170]|uniref:Uncharacterized protein n=1 Tax=Pochonia chlamydosporia 170 TaxID=1380566 RepID=A0A179EY17_METCM|nr:hypothetical protein VFPPC_14915 [Pochonia chlamydosporia 170]OAQ58081.1 hypothetical protein VFPPC_14915 [Pochonia chlamydosporia 170]
MRKDKESKEFVWWPSFHRGLDDYYQQVESHGKLRKPLPSTCIKHHPNDGWKLAPDAAADECMPYVVQPEQDLLRLSEEEIYAKLGSLREHWSAGTLAPQPDPNAVVLEFNIRSSNYGRPPPRWDVKHRAYISRTWDESNSPGTCATFLRQELEKYEVLLHHRRSLRSRNSHEISGQIWRGSESEPISDDTDATSDEESLGQKRLRQAKLVRKIESLMRQLITLEREKNKSPKQWEHLEKEFKHRLDNVQDVE